MFAKEEFLNRQNKLRETMEKHGLDAVCIAGSAQLDTRGYLRYYANYYLPVFEEYLVIPKNGPTIFFAHDGCGADYARQYSVVDEIKVIPEAEYNSNPAYTVTNVLKELNCKNVGVYWGRAVSSAFCNSFVKHAEGMILTDVSHFVKEQRAIKSAAEIELMRQAVKFNEDCLEAYVKEMAIGKSELEAVNKASFYAIESGAEDLYWMTSSAKSPTLAYLAASWQKQHVWENGDYHYLVLEHSVQGGYYSEITQLISFGKAKAEYVKALQAVAFAQEAAANEIKIGVPVSNLAKASHKVLAELGYANPEAAAPCIGHSQGIDAWEFPRLAADEKMLVQAGMRFNIHPAVALPDGAKITSCITYLSTETGFEKLSKAKNEIIEL